MVQTVEFLRCIYGAFQGEETFVITHLYKDFVDGKKQHPKSFRYRVADIESIDWDDHIEANRNGWDIYFGAALREPSLLMQRGNSRGVVENCVLSTCMATDLDFASAGAHKAENLPANIEEAACVIDKMPEPSIIVDSGHGAHLYHVYTAPVLLKTALERRQYGRERKACQARYSKELKRNGWGYDATWTIDRIWRLPGFLNWKVREAPQEVRVLYGLEETVKYVQQDLIPVKQTAKAPAPPTIKLPEGTRTPITQRVSNVDTLLESLKAYKEKYHDDAVEAAASADEDIRDGAEDIAARSYYIQQLLAGESIEDKGNRDVALTTLCGIICRLTPDTPEFTDEHLEYIASIFEGSLTAWVDDDIDTDLTREMGKVIDKLRRLKSKDRENQAVGLEGLRKAVSQFREGKGDEKADDPLADEPEEDLQQLLQVGLITYEAFVYCWDWTKQRYFTRPAKTKDELRMMIRVCWPEDDVSCPFKHSFINEEGRAVDLPFDHLHRQFGSIAEFASMSFLEPQTCFDLEKRRFTIVPQPWRYTEPVFNPDIDHWLKLLGGDNYDMLCDWLAGVTRLDRPCAALYLDGPPGCGKSLLAHCAAQLWYTRAPLYEEVIDQFNEALLLCPIILIDEGFVNSAAKSNPTMVMRRLIAQDSHSVNKKFGPKLRLESHLRFIIAANNDSVLLTGKEERLSENDSRAMAERVAYIKIDEKARNFFIAKNKDNRLTKSWVDGGDFARHLLWLRDNRTLNETGRFLVEGKESRITQQMVFQGSERSLVFEWIVRFCCAPARLNSRSVSALLAADIGNGVVVVNTTKMGENWKEFCPASRDILEHSHLLRHIKAISSQSGTIKVRIGEDTQRYWVIDIGIVIAYAEAYDIGDIERIKENAKLDTEITRKILSSSQYKKPESDTEE